MGKEQHKGSRRRPTLRDVALEAGLSVTQASRALNGHDDVATATRERAAKAAKAIGYVPNLEARRLKMPNTGAHTIGLVLSGQGRRFSDPFFAELLSWVADEAAGNGFEIQLSTPPTDEDPLAAYRRAIGQQRVDGFIVTRLEIDDRRVEYLLGENFPFVTYGRLLPDPGGFPVIDEADESLRPAVDLLVDLNGDGLAERIIGLPNADGGAPASGAVIVLRGVGNGFWRPWYWFGQRN